MQVPILAIGNRVLFPNATIRISLGKAESVNLVQDLVSKPLTECTSPTKQQYIGIVSLVPDGESNEYAHRENSKVFTCGTLAKIVQVCHLKMDNSEYSILVQGVKRMVIHEFVQFKPFWIGSISEMVLASIDDAQVVKSKMVQLRNAAKEWIQLLDGNHELMVYAKQFMKSMLNSTFVDMLAFHMDISVVDKYKILASDCVMKRCELMLMHVKEKLLQVQVAIKIQHKMENQMQDTRRVYYLKQQLMAIKEELSSMEGNSTTASEDELDDDEQLKNILMNMHLPDGARKMVLRDLKKLAALQPSQSEYRVIQTYLEWIADLPWNTESIETLTLNSVRGQLNRDHFGLHKVKCRIEQYIAVQCLKQKRNAEVSMAGPILCLVGPPGVGKTSLGISIAKATNRKFERISLGGVHDESEIRGHRRTYVGAMPGSIIHAIKRAKRKNPVLLLDEIDKLGKGHAQGDPASALLEVLDPAQNHSFVDHYLNTPFDVSKVFFVATANSIDSIPRPLLDRMEIIHVNGYMINEKVKIAERYLVPKQQSEHCVSENQVQFPQGSMEYLIHHYTRESGVRKLEQCLAAIFRHVAVQVVEFEMNDQSVPFAPIMITIPVMVKILGVESFDSERASTVGYPGVATGMAWTPTGGEILFVEATQMAGSGKLSLTGQLGDVMKESIMLALSWIRSNTTCISKVLSSTFNLKDFTLQLPLPDRMDIHVHFPAGAIPKDGPSAGVAIVIALISMFTSTTIPSTISMTGEISLRGLVLPVGGIKEKVIAAHRAGIQRVLLPSRNKKNAESELPSKLLSSISILYVDSLLDALSAVFESTSPNVLPTPLNDTALRDTNGPILSSFL